jgi:hypothetical protein
LLKPFAAPTSGSPTYTLVSAGSYTASIPYTVASGVSQINVVKSSDAITTYSVVPTAMRQILAGFPSLGAKRTWTFTMNSTLGSINLVAGSMIPLHIDFRSDRILLSTYSGTVWGPDAYIMSGFHNLARPTTFTVAFDTKTFLIRYDNNTKTAVYLNQQNISLYDINNTPTLLNATYTGPVLTQPTWKMRIAFRSTGAHNSWRAIIGEMRNNIIDRGWGVWISDTNYIHFSWNGPTYNATELTVAQNTDYMLAITKNSTTLTLALTNVSSNTTQTATMQSNMMSANGPVTVGGWIQNNAPEVFVGTISSVVVEPLNIIASAVVSGNTAAITVPFTDADSPLDIVAIALSNAVGGNSAASATQTLIKQFAVPTLSGSITYSGTTASMTYTVASGVTAVQVKNALNNNVITGTITNVSGTTATITVPFTDADSPLGIVIVALGNAVGRESAASATQTLLKQFAAPLSGSITYSGTTASMTYTVESGVTQVQLRKASDNAVITTANVTGTTGTITATVTENMNVVLVALGNAVGQESAASTAETLLIGKVIYVSVGRHLDGANKNSIACSLDGLNWTTVPNNIFTDYGAAVHHSAKLSRWVAVGQGTNSIAHSTNGVNWFPVTNSTAIFSGSGRGVAYSAALSRWVAVGGGTNNIAHSTDGITWDGLGTNHFTGGGGLGVCYSAELSRWVAVGHGTNTSTIAYSTDGLTWTGVANSTSIFSEGGLGVAYGGSKWVAVGLGTHSIAYSTDGITWQGVANSTSIFSTKGQGVAYSVQLSRWVAVGRGTNSIAYSTDGITWYGVANSTSIFQTVGNSVSHNSDQSRWVAVGQGTNSIAHSTDGITWTAVPTSNSTFNVIGVGIGLLTQFAKPVRRTSPFYSINYADPDWYNATLTYEVDAGVTALNVVMTIGGTFIYNVPIVMNNTVNTVSNTAEVMIGFTHEHAPLSVRVVALANVSGRASVESSNTILNVPYYI